MDVFKLTTEELEFLGMVNNVVQSAAMRRNANVVPRRVDLTEFNKTDSLSVGDAKQQLSADCVPTANIVTPEIKAVLQLKAANKRRDRKAKFSATLRLSEVLSTALRAAAISRSLNCVMHVRLPQHITIGLIGPFGNVGITNGSAPGFRQTTMPVENRPELQQVQSIDCVQTADSIVTVEIKSAVLPAVICKRQTDDDIVKKENVDQPEAATAVRRRRPILSALGRRLLKVGRILCCWCNTVPYEDKE